jgi:lipooligosaccharide transport system permease protein
MTPLMLLSGVFFPIGTLPPLLQEIIHWLPLVHTVELVRPLVAGLPLPDTVTHLGVMIAYALGGYLIAVRFVKQRLRV